MLCRVRQIVDDSTHDDDSKQNVVGLSLVCLPQSCEQRAMNEILQVLYSTLCTPTHTLAMQIACLTLLRKCYYQWPHWSSEALCFVVINS